MKARCDIAYMLCRALNHKQADGTKDVQRTVLAFTRHLLLRFELDLLLLNIQCMSPMQSDDVEDQGLIVSSPSAPEPKHRCHARSAAKPKYVESSENESEGTSGELDRSGQESYSESE